MLKFFALPMKICRIDTRVVLLFAESWVVESRNWKKPDDGIKFMICFLTSRDFTQIFRLGGLILLLCGASTNFAINAYGDVLKSFKP